MATVPTPYYAVLDRSAIPDPVWILLRRADRNVWMSAAETPEAVLPALLNEVGSYDSDETGRVAGWLTGQLARPVELAELPATGGNAFRITYRDDEGNPNP